jgi:glycosidase
VKSQLINWIRTLMDYGFDGLRIDTVPEIEPGFWVDFVSAANTYAVLPLPSLPTSTFPQIPRSLINACAVCACACAVCAVRGGACRWVRCSRT